MWMPSFTCFGLGDRWAQSVISTAGLAASTVFNGFLESVAWKRGSGDSRWAS